MLLNLHTKVSDFAELDSIDKIELDTDLTQQQVVDLIIKHKDQKYSDLTCEVIIHQYNFLSDEMLITMLENSSSAILANEIATSGKAGEKILNQLLSHPSESVREHAELALLSNRITRMNSKELEEFYFELLEKDYELLNEAKTYFAHNPNTPKSVLTMILNESNGMLVDIIKKNMENK